MVIFDSFSSQLICAFFLGKATRWREDSLRLFSNIDAISRWIDMDKAYFVAFFILQEFRVCLLK